MMELIFLLDWDGRSLQYRNSVSTKSILFCFIKRLSSSQVKLTDPPPAATLSINLSENKRPWCFPPRSTSLLFILFSAATSTSFFAAESSTFPLSLLLSPMSISVPVTSQRKEWAALMYRILLQDRNTSCSWVQFASSGLRSRIEGLRYKIVIV